MTRVNNFRFRHLWLEKPAPCRSGRRELNLELTQICQSTDVDRVYAVGFAGTRRLSDDITEEKGAVNRRVEVHMMPYAPPGRL